VLIIIPSAPPRNGKVPQTRVSVHSTPTSTVLAEVVEHPRDVSDVQLCDANGCQSVPPGQIVQLDLNGDGAPDVAVDITELRPCQHLARGQSLFFDVDQEVLGGVPQGESLSERVQVTVTQWNGSGPNCQSPTPILTPPETTQPTPTPTPCDPATNNCPTPTPCVGANCPTATPCSPPACTPTPTPTPTVQPAVDTPSPTPTVTPIPTDPFCNPICL
jgi:hypothetical protein